MREQRTVLLAIRVINFMFGHIFPSIRRLMFPFRLLTMLIEWIRLFIWLLSNEYTKHRFGRCGRGVHINGRFRVTAPENMVIGDNVHINDNAFIRAEGGLSIGDHTHISRNVVIYTMNHQYEGELLPYNHEKILKPVKIGSNVWIGMNVAIVPGVTIGDGAIIGLGAVVSQDVPPMAVVGSPPIRILKERNKKHYDSLVDTDAHGGMGGYRWK